jgi:hypothetical protein
MQGDKKGTVHLKQTWVWHQFPILIARKKDHGQRSSTKGFNQ